MNFIPGIIASTPLIVGPTARYWRLCITESGTNSKCAIDEIEFRNSPGGADLTTPAGAITAATTNSWSGSDVTRVRHAFNDSISLNSERWETDATDNSPWWVMYDFVSAVRVAEYLITAEDSPGRNPVDWTLEYSDNSSDWAVAHTVVAAPTWGAFETRTYNGYLTA